MKVKKPSMLRRLDRNQKGFTLVELLLVIALTGIIGTVAAMSIHQILTGTVHSNDQNTAINQVRNAGYWISRDAQMAEDICFNNTSPEEFLILKWTQWGYDEPSVYHSVTYSFEKISQEGLGRFKRTHTATDGTREEAFIADHIYYNTTSANYTSPVLTVQITAKIGDATETRQYEITRRPTF